MDISYNWLKDLVEFDLSPQDLAARLTSVGLAVEGIHAAGEDHVFDIDLTSNRGDCLSHLGVAREISVIAECGMRNVDSPEGQSPKTEGRNLVTVADPDLCHRFTARVIRNVKIGPSPEWLTQRLEAVGERSINNVADITNYVMHELGNPMHSFDLNKLKGNRIVARRARAGEKIKTLDEVERKLNKDVLAICDAEKPVAVGGVMGGFDSGITEETTDVLLEVAYFSRESIRQTSRKLGLATEASYRFERGVDIENLRRASDRATQLICELAGGTAGEFVDVYPTKSEQSIISLRPARVKGLTGLAAEAEDVKRILTALGFAFNAHFTKNDGGDLRLSFTVPSWRHDIEREEDLVEEVARHIGYEKIAEELPPAFGAGEYQPSETRKRAARRALIAQGFDEAISYSFIDAAHDGRFELAPGLVDEKLDDQFITLQDSIIEGASRMRASLLPGLLDGLRTNLNHQRRDLKFFEIGKVFAAQRSEDDLPNERELFALAMMGSEMLEDKAIGIRAFDFYDAKGALESVFYALGFSSVEFAAAEVKHLRRGQSAAVVLDGERVGSLGRLDEEIAAGYKFKQPVFVAEIDLQTVLAMKASGVSYYPLPKFPGIVRDVSFGVKRDLSLAQIKRAIAEQRVEICRAVEFVDIYQGKGLADDERSLTVRLEYRSDERTLIDEEVEQAHAGILKGLEESLGVKPRV
jgi:phenylalanyl-tRNA synthetase beta chain